MTRALGVDCGRKRVGLALSDPLGLGAGPLEVVDRAIAVEEIVAIALDKSVDVIVIGMPTGLGGHEGASAADARNFGDEIRRQTGVEIVYWDERFTSRIAEERLLESGMKRRARRSSIDKMAAAVILQDYLDSIAQDG